MDKAIIKSSDVLEGLKRKTSSVADTFKNLGVEVEHIRVEAVNEQLLLLIDDSGSMADVMEGRASKCDVLNKVLSINLIPNLEGWKCGIRGLTGGLRVPLTIDTILLNSYRGTADGHDTPYMSALREGLYDLNGKGRMILLSDGVATDGSTDEILALVTNRGIIIDTVGIGFGASSYNALLLKEIARVTGGVFVEAHTIDQLTIGIKKLSPKFRGLLSAGNGGTNE